MSIKLDVLDRKILYALDSNARVSISDLSRQMKHGRDIVDYRVSRLFNEGVIVRAGAVVDPYRLGLTLFKTYLRLNNNRTRCAQLLSTLKKSSQVFCVAHCDGQWDIVFNALARNAREFDAVQEDLLNPFTDIISDSEVAVVVEQRYYFKKFLTGKGEGAFIIGMVPSNLELDTLDSKLLSSLVRNSRMPVSEMAEVHNSTPVVIKRRIENLEERKIVVGYRIEIDRAKLGITRFKTQVTFLNSSKARVAALQRYCELHPNISNHIKQVGKFKLECSVDAENYEHFNKIVDDIRSKFCDIIHNVGTLLIREELYRWVSDDSERILGKQMLPPADSGERIPG